MKRILNMALCLLLLCLFTRPALAEGLDVEVYKDLEDFAGLYLDGNEQWVVCIVGLTAEREAELQALTPHTQVIFQNAKYTEKEMLAFQHEVAMDEDAPVNRLKLGVGYSAASDAIIVTVGDEDLPAAKAYYEAKYGDRVQVQGGGKIVVPMTGDRLVASAAIALLCAAAVMGALAKRYSA